MMFGTVSLGEMEQLAPYGLLFGGALFVLFVSLSAKPEKCRGILTFASAGIVLAAALSLLSLGDEVEIFNRLLIHDRLGAEFSLIGLALLFLVLPAYASGGVFMKEGAGGVFAMLLLSATGLLCMAFSNHLLTFFLGLEILSLPLYVLAGVGRDSAKATEAAFKYFLLGSVASALFVFGSAVLWGTLGTATLTEMSEAFTRQGYGNTGAAAVGLSLVMAGLLFKLGLVPFHMWVPDVVEGSPSFLVSWMSGAVKAAAAVFGVRLFGRIFPAAVLDFSALLSAVAIASMIWGSIAALQQENLKRMLAYSSIAHAGYLTIGLVCAHAGMGADASGGMAYYVFTYGAAALAAFTVIGAEEPEGRVTVSQFAGLARRRPILALAFSVALLSLAGLPPLAGFFAKFNLFALAVRCGHMELVAVGVVTSVISVAYYLKIIVSLYMREPTVTGKPALPAGFWLTLTAACALVVVLGLFPDLLTGFFDRALPAEIP